MAKIVCGGSRIVCSATDFGTCADPTQRRVLHWKNTPPWNVLWPDIGVALLAFRASGHLMNLRYAAAQVALYRRARHRAIRAEHTAIAREWLKSLTAALAVIEELAGIGRHCLDSLIAAFWGK